METTTSAMEHDEAKLIVRHSAREHKPRKRSKTPEKWSWKKLPWVAYGLTLVCSIVFIAELGRSVHLTGTAFQTKPSFNPMLGPSAYVLINMGSRFDACMRPANASDYIWPCPNSTSTDTDVCTIEELCGFSLDSGWQWWRLITAIFLHSGFVHIILNMILLALLGAQLERKMGHVLVFLVFFLSGIGGFVLSANFAGSGTSSVGASGACFGLIAVEFLDLLFNWALYQRPWVTLGIHIAEIIISFVLGLLPGLDNFAHIGGFAVGLMTGIIMMRSPLQMRIKQNPNPRRKFDVVKVNWRKPFEHVHARTPRWWVWVVVRAGALAVLLVYYVLLIRLYVTDSASCSWCKYLSCLPVNGWCDTAYQGV